MQLNKLISFLESVAPPQYQESYDNSGLIVGDPNQQIKGVLICLDSIERVIDEAIKTKCNVVIAHHPIIFSGLKRITGKNYIEKTIIKAIKNDIAIYAIHTNLDNMLYNGVNQMIGKKLELMDTRILVPKKGLKKLITTTPVTHSEKIRKALFKAGAGEIGYNGLLSYSSLGYSTQNGSSDGELKLEVAFAADKESAIIKALKNTHPSDEAVHEIVSLENQNEIVGSGLIGEMRTEYFPNDFLLYLKEKMKLNVIRHTKLPSKRITTVAVCGGSGSFLLKPAIAQKADIFITADFKYHEFFDANDQIVIADIGHYESERFTIDLLYDIISKKFRNFAVRKTGVNTNPITYTF